jgi:hypothetical protein
MPRPSAASFAVPSFAGQPDRLKAPPDLTEAERKIFVRIVGDCKPGHFQLSELDLLRAYCTATALVEEAREKLWSEGRLTADGKPSPWLNQLTQQQRTQMAYSRRLRIGPQSRMPNNPTRPAPQLSYYERQDLEQYGAEEN